MNRMLGKLPATYDRRTLRLSNYLDLSKLPPLPETDNNYQKLSRMTMAGNSEYGDCVVAGCAHIIQLWSSMSSREVVLPDKTIINTYLKLTGGQDIGLNVLYFLKYWRKNPIASHPLGAFVAINPTNMLHMKYAIYLFGAVYTGIGLPLSAQNQQVWDLVEGGPSSEAFSWGGHLTICGNYDKSGNLGNYTWAEVIPMTPNFIKCYVDEAYGLLSLDWFTTQHKSPDGFAWKDLLSDLNKLTK